MLLDFECHQKKPRLLGFCCLPHQAADDEADHREHKIGNSFTFQAFFQQHLLSISLQNIGSIKFMDPLTTLSCRSPVLPMLCEDGRFVGRRCRCVVDWNLNRRLVMFVQKTAIDFSRFSNVLHAGRRAKGAYSSDILILYSQK